MTVTTTTQARPHRYLLPLSSSSLIHMLTCPLFRLQTGNFTTRRNVFPIRGDRTLVVPHWQLRDLVQTTPYRPHSVFYVNNTTLREVDLTTGKVSRAASSFEFAPRCYGILDDFVLAGSDNGWIQAQSLDRSKDDVLKSQLSTQINNNICLYTALDGTRRALIG